MISIKFRSFYISLFVFFATTIYSETIQFKYNLITKYKAEATIKGKININGELQTDYNQYYKVISTVTPLNENGLSTINEEGFYYITNSTSPSLKEINSNIKVSYFKDSHGIIFAPTTVPFPVMRNIPYFISDDIKPSDTWEFEGLEVQEFFHDKVITVFPVSVKYLLKNIETINNEEIAEIEYTIKANVINSFDGTIDKRINKIEGSSKNILFFNITNGLQEKEIYNRQYSITINNFLEENVYEFIDSGERVWTAIEKIEESIFKDIENETKEIEDVKISKDERGIKLSLEAIEFLPDSADLTETEKLRLKKIAQILEKYKDKQSLIVGHTTDRGTEKKRELLSIERARSVADYLIEKSAINKENTQIMGKGGKEPIDSNNTLEGLRRNRRVEIYLLEE